MLLVEIFRRRKDESAFFLIWAEGLEVVAVNYQIVVEGDLLGEGFVLAGDELMVFDREVVVLDKGFSFEIQGCHRASEFS
jgi:predicted RecB family endonuclease